MQKTRPKHLDLPKIRLPLPGLVSILHRISGVLLFVSLPVILYLFQGTLSSEAAFDGFRANLAFWPVKVVLLGFLWAYLHHACAGIRFLFLDIHRGTDLPTARLTAKVVLVVSLALTAVIGGLLW